MHFKIKFTCDRSDFNNSIKGLKADQIKNVRVQLTMKYSPLLLVVYGRASGEKYKDIYSINTF